ncbi:ABC transporter substrate-binding protein [Clostridium arbusti]|uniref:ABC transporter substrate-binding protein n=1 Tax=Clostridium arbusti TaxID=1137848 RepID=UPI00028A3987|nr:extracellular solute-binding protein [Clostridium arbusti]
MKYIKRICSLFMVFILLSFLLVGCGSERKADKKTTIEFFAFKPEAVNIFKQLGEKFEKENPNIKVYVNTPNDAYSLLKARIVKGDVPDIVGLGAEQYYVDYAKAGVFTDLADSEVIKKVKPAYSEMLADLEGESGRVHAVPYAANATGVIYNKDLFNQMGLKIPKTWAELEEVCKTIQKQGKTPFYMGYKDDWTINCAWNPLAGNFTDSDFYGQVTDGKKSFSKSYEEPLKRLEELTKFSQGDVFSYSYNNATVGFAKGESVMYIQGNWAIPMIKKTNPSINIGIFPMPVMDNEKENKLCSSIDVMFSITKNSKHPKEAMKFLEFLMEQENVNNYMKDQYGISALEYDFNYPGEMDGIVKDFESGNVVSSPQAFYPSEMSISTLLQTYLLDKDKEKLFSQMNAYWKEAHMN